jgi:hypothetical protein
MTASDSAIVVADLANSYGAVEAVKGFRLL